MNCVSAAITAAASSGDASGATIESSGRRFIGDQRIAQGMDES
jgi:hypothetical protein